MAFDVDTIRRALPEHPREQLEVLEVFAEIASTNDYLLQQARPHPGRFRVAFAEHQTAGRGRRGRDWLSPRFCGLYLSLSYTFASPPPQLPCLTLAIGIGVAGALEKLGIRGIGLKWPNDIVACDGKAGGILTEIVPGKSETPTAVIGVGLNLDFGQSQSAVKISGSLGSATDLRCCAKNLPDRAIITAMLIEQLFGTLERFDTDGFTNFFEDWRHYDWLRGQRVSLDTGNGQVTGMVKGIEADGAIIIESEGASRSFRTGSVSLVA
jgi:BirA family biotin operon repressor/biotin-[acetyl-CoA-carboxylase] ligase